MTKEKKLQRGGAGPKAIGLAVSRVAKPILGKHGFADGGIITQWDSIVGPDLAERALPMKVAFPRNQRDHGTLFLKVAGGAMAVELQHLEPLIRERVNGYFGYQAIEKIKILQGPLPRKALKKPDSPPSIDEETEAELKTSLEGIDDPDLKDSLGALGRAILGRRGTNKKTSP